MLFAVLAAGIAVLFLTALHGLERGEGDTGRRQLEETLRRTCVACYAAEGRYPPGLDKLREDYGVLLDTTRYDVHYHVAAENLMPDITVVEREP